MRRVRNLSALMFLAVFVIAGGKSASAVCYAPLWFGVSSSISQFDCFDFAYQAAAGWCGGRCSSVCSSNWVGVYTPNNCAFDGSNWTSGTLECECS